VETVAIRRQRDIERERERVRERERGAEREREILPELFELHGMFG